MHFMCSRSGQYNVNTMDEMKIEKQHEDTLFY